VKDANGKVLVENDQMNEEWRKYMEKLLNEENTWDNTTTCEQEAELMLTTGSTRLAVSRGQQTWYHSTCYMFSRSVYVAPLWLPDVLQAAFKFRF